MIMHELIVHIMKDKRALIAKSIKPNDWKQEDNDTRKIRPSQETWTELKKAIKENKDNLMKVSIDVVCELAIILKNTRAKRFAVENSHKRQQLQDEEKRIVETLKEAL